MLRTAIKTIFILILVPLLIFSALLLLLPTALSTSSGKNIIVDQINSNIPGKIAINSLDLGWFSSQKIDNFTLKNPEGEIILSFDQAQLNLSLLQAILKNFSGKPLTVHNLQAKIVSTSDHSTNLEQALGIKTERLSSLPLERPIFLENVNLDLTWQNSSNNILLKGSGITREGDLEGSFKIDADLGKTHKVQIVAEQFPVLVLDQLISIQNPKYSGIILDLVGAQIDLRVNLVQEGAQNTLHVEGSSPQIALKLEGQTNGKEATIETGNVKFALSPETFKRLSDLSDTQFFLKLISPLQGTAQLNDLHLSYHRLENAFGEVNLQFSPFVFLSYPSQQEVYLERLISKLIFPKGGEELTIDVESSGVQNNEPLQAHLNLILKKQEIISLLTQKAKIDWKALSISLDGTISHFPLPLLCNLLGVDRELCFKTEALLGTSIDAKVQSSTKQMNGPIFLNVIGDNGSLSLNGDILNGFLTLKEPLHGALRITPQFEKLILSEMLPFATAILAANEPVEYIIDPSNFSLPIRNFSLEQVSIGQGMLNLHKITFSRAGQMGKIASLLNITAPQFEIWFTPLYFNAYKGTVTSSRVDMLVANYFPIAAWGSVDISNNRLHMSIALSGQALAKAFGITGLPKEYMLAIPLFGGLSNPQLDTSRVAARVSALLARTRAGGKGALIGTLLEAASGSLTSDKIPSPTTNPLPWDDGRFDEPVDNVQDQPSAETINPVKELRNDFKELKKGAGKMLKEFFR